MNSLGQQVAAVFRDSFQGLITALPRVTLALVAALVAILFASLVRRLVGATLRRRRLSELLERTDAARWLHRIGVRQPMEEFLPRVVFWLLLLLFLRTTTEVLGLTPISEAIGAFLAYLPDVLAAVLILVLGSFAARAAGAAVKDLARSTGSDVSGTLGRMVNALILFVVMIMALSQLRVETEIVRMVTMTLIASVGLAFALAFGLGARTVMAHVMAGYYLRKTFEVGCEIDIGGRVGTLIGVTPTQTLIRVEQQTLVLSNSDLMEREKSRLD